MSFNITYLTFACLFNCDAFLSNISTKQVRSKVFLECAFGEKIDRRGVFAVVHNFELGDEDRCEVRKLKVMRKRRTQSVRQRFSFVLARDILARSASALFTIDK